MKSVWHALFSRLDLRMLAVSMLAAAAIGGAPGAQVTVLYQQIFDGTASDSVGSDFDGQQIADNFTLGASASVRSVTWTGVWNESPGPNADFRIRFYAGSAGVPFGSPLADFTVTVATVGGLGIGDYQALTAVLPSAVALTGGVEYWLSITESDPDTPLGFFWGDTATGNGTAQFDGDAGLWLPSGAPGVAFALLDDVPAQVPVPGTLALMVWAGLYFLLGRGRWRVATVPTIA